MLFMLIILLLIAGCSSAQHILIPHESGPEIEIRFVPHTETTYVRLISGSGSCICAFYDLRSSKVIAAAKDAGCLLYLDDRNYMKNNGLYNSMDGLIMTDGSRVMHNKFCVINKSIVITGSYNPTYRGSNINRNNVVVIGSHVIAESYLNYLDALIYGKKRIRGSKTYYNGHLIESFFCPECSSRIFTDLIDDADSSVRFLFFSFTDDDISESLIRAKNRGVDVSGIMESSQFSRYSEYHKLKDAGVDVIAERTGSNMHHKAMIIDESIVLTGSANPSRNGLERNDENILIIHDPDAAQDFLMEFSGLKAEIMSYG